MEEKAFILKIGEDRGGLVEGECDNRGSRRRGASSGSRVGADREDDDFCLGNVQAMVRSDLLITHGISEQDTLYLIKREEARETDFWHKIDKPRNGAETSREEAQAGDFRADAAREEKEPQKNSERLANVSDAVTKTSFRTGESQEAPCQHRKRTEVALTGTHKVPDVYVCTEDERSEVTPPHRFKRTHDESITGKKLEGIPVHCCKESSSLSKRALQLLRGTRKNSIRGQEGGTAVTGTQGKPQECEDRVGDREGGGFFFAKVGAELVEPADARGDLHFEDDSNFAVLSRPTRSELGGQFRKQHAGDEQEADSAHVSSRDQDGTVEQNSAMPPMQRCSMHLVPTLDTEVCGFAVPASPLAALFARAGLKMQADTEALLEGNDLAAGDHAAVQLPQVIISAAESDEERILWGTVKHAVHRPETHGTSVAWISAVAKSAAPPVMQKHEHNTDEIEKEDATVLEGRLQRRWQEKRRQKEPQEVHLPRGAEQPETELQGTQQLSVTWQDALLPRLQHETGDCVLLPGLPLEQQRQQRDSQQQQRQERLQQPAERRAQGPPADVLGKQSATGKDEGRQEGGKVTGNHVHERVSLNQVDSQRLALLRDTSPAGSGVSSATDQKQEEIEKTDRKKKLKGREVGRKDEIQEGTLMDRWSVCARTNFTKSGTKKKQWLSLAAGKRDLVHASECAQAHSSPYCEAGGGVEIEDGSHLTSFIKRGNSTENPAFIETTSAVSLRRGNALQGPPATLARGNFFIAVQPGRPTAKVDTSAQEKENFFQDGNRGSCVNANKTGEATASPPYCSKEPWQEEHTRLRSLSGGGAAEGCAPQTLMTRRQQQQAEEDWVYFKQFRRNSSGREQGGVRTSRTRTTQGRELEGCKTSEGKMFSSLGRGSITADAEFDAVKKGNIHSEREVMLQCLQEIGRRFEAPRGGQHRGAKETRMRYRNLFTQKSSATCVTSGWRASLRQRVRRRTRLVRQGLQLGGELRETKTMGMRRGVSGLRFCRVNYLKSTPLYTKHASHMRRLLRTTRGGGGNRANELARRWLDESSSEAASGDSSTSQSKEEKKAWTQNAKRPEASCQWNSGDQQQANSLFVEEERISQSSSGTSCGWINIEKYDEQEDGGDDEQHFFEKDCSALEVGGNLFCTGEPPAEMPAKRLAQALAESNSGGGAGVATSPFPAVSSQTTASDACLGSSSSGVDADKRANSSSSTWKGVRRGNSGMQQSDGNLDGSFRRRSLQATLKPSRFLEMVKERKMLEAAGSTWHGERHFRGAHEGCAVTDRAHGHDKHGGMEELDEGHPKEAPARGCTQRVRPLVGRHSPSSSVSSRAGWETLETETASAVQQTSPKYDAAQGTRLEADETKHAANPPAVVLRRGAVDENMRHTQARPEYKGITGDRDTNKARGCGASEQCREGVRAGERTDDEEEPGETIRKMRMMSLVAKKPNKWAGEGEGGKNVTAAHSFEPGTPPGSGTSFLSLFGSAPGWSLLKKGWTKQNEKEKAKEEDSQGTKERDSHKGICECDCRIASLENGTFGIVGDSSEKLPGLINSDRANVTKHGDRFSSVRSGVPARKSSISGADLGSGSSTNNYGARRGRLRRRVLACCDSRSTDRGRSSRRTSSRLRDSSSSCRAQGSSGGSIEWGVRGSIGRHRSSSESNSTNILRMSSIDSDGGTPTGAFSERSKGIYVASSDGAAEGAGSAREPPRKMNMHAGEEIRQHRSTSAHALAASTYTPSRKRLPCRTGGSATGAKRRGGRVAVDKLGRNLYLCDSRCRRNRILLKQLEKEAVMCTIGKQATGHLLRGSKYESRRDRAVAARTHVNNDLWHSGALQTAPLNSRTCTQVRGDNSSRTNCDSSNRDVQARLRQLPSWTLRRQSATGGGVTFQSGSRISSALPSVYPFPPAAAHFFSATPFSSAVDTSALIGSGPLPVSPAAAPLYTKDVATGNILSPVYVSGAATGCFSRFLRAAPAASAPAAAAAQAAATASRSQAVSAVAEEVFGNALLRTSSCHTLTSTIHRHIARDGGCVAAAATTSPFWCRWPAAVLRVIGLPLRTVVHLLGLNVSGAYDRWRGEIRQRSLRGFLTLCLLDGVVCAAAVWSVWHLAVFATRGAFKTAYLHVHNIDAERTSHYFDGLTYRFWGKRPLYFTDNPLLGAGRAADAEIATDPWNGLQQLQQRGIAWYQHRMYGDL